MRIHDRRPVVVIGVNGTPIDRDRFYRCLETATGPQVIHKLVQDELTIQFARKKGLMPAEPEVDSRFFALSKQPNFEQYLAAHYLTPEDFKQNLRVSMARTAVLGQGVTVTDDEVRKFYDQNIDPANSKSRYYTPETVQLAVIVTRKETEAYAALSDLAHATSWGVVAQTHSVDPSGKTGGVLPPMMKGRSPLIRIPGMEAAVFGMEKGKQLGPQQFGGAWWIIRCLDKKPAQTQPFESVQEDCRTAATIAKGVPANAKKVDAEFQTFEKNANIQAFWPQYSQAVTAAGR